MQRHDVKGLKSILQKNLIPAIRSRKLYAILCLVVSHDITQGCIIKLLPHGESSQVVVIYCQDFGRQAFYARSASKSKRRFGGSLDLFAIGECSYQPAKSEGGLFQLVAFSAAEINTELSANLDKFAAASMLVEAADTLGEDTAVNIDQFFDTIRLGLEAINVADTPRAILKAFFLSLKGLLILCGFFDQSRECIPNIKNLRELIKLAQSSTGREFKSLPAVLGVMAAVGGSS